MKTIVTIALLVFSATTFAQGLKYESQNDALNDMFYDLDIDSGDDILVEQIEHHPTIHFVSTGKSDTLWFGGKSVVFTTPKNIGMPEYRLVGGSIDEPKTDSTFIFLGGGVGVAFSDRSSDSKSYTIETVEINRYFSDSRKANELYIQFCSQIAELLPDAEVFDWDQENGSSRTISLGNESKDDRLFSKQLVVEWYELNEDSNPIYIISLSYEKSILNEVL